MKTAFWALFALLAMVALAFGQDGPISGRPIGEGSESVRDSAVGSMHSGTIGGASVGSVRSSSAGSMISGPVSEISAGSARSGRPMALDPPSGAASSGAMRQPSSLPPLRVQRPVSAEELELLEQRLRNVEPLPE